MLWVDTPGIVLNPETGVVSADPQFALPPGRHVDYVRATIFKDGTALNEPLSFEIP